MNFWSSLLCVALLAACSKAEPPPPPPQAAAPPPPPPPLVVKIGHAAPLTGPQAHLGKDNEAGVKLALEDANAAKIAFEGRPVRFELLSEDDQANPEQGKTLAMKFVDAKVAGVVGHLNSGTTMPASRVYVDANVPQVSPSATTYEYTHQGFKTAFRVMTNDGQQGKVLGEYAVQKLHAHKIAIIDDKTQYGEGIALEFRKAAEAAGAQIVAQEHTDDKAVDFAAILTRVKGKKPDLVFYGGMDAQAGPMAAQLRKLGVKALFLMADGGCTAKFHELSAGAGEASFCSLPGQPLEKMPGGVAFKERFARTFNMPIQLYAPYAYDAAMVLVEAIRRAGSVEGEKIIGELKKSQHKGVTGLISFDEYGDVKDPAVTLYIAKNGQWEALETIGGPAPEPTPAPSAAAPAAASAPTATPTAAPSPAAVAAPAAPAAPPAAPATKP